MSVKKSANFGTYIDAQLAGDFPDDAQRFPQLSLGVITEGPPSIAACFRKCPGRVSLFIR